MPDMKMIILSEITVPSQRLRAVREENVIALVQSMAEQGQLQPVVVRRDGSGGYWLVAGVHRLEAAKRLRWREINCAIFDNMDADQAELAEIDENLIRAPLTPAEEAAHLGKRKELYEKLHPETKHGAVGRRGKRSQNATCSGPADAFIDDTAKKTGKHRATIARKAARARKVVVLCDVVGTSLDKGAELDALSKLPAEQQRRLAEAVKRGEQVSAIGAECRLKTEQMQEDAALHAEGKRIDGPSPPLSLQLAANFAAVPMPAITPDQIAARNADEAERINTWCRQFHEERRSRIAKERAKYEREIAERNRRAGWG